MRDGQVQVGSVVQIDPAHDELFGGHFLIVTEIKEWGVQGYVKPLELGNKVAYYRVKWEAITYIGQAEWMMK